MGETCMSSSPPAHSSELSAKIPTFKRYLQDRGSEIRSATNSWEVLRFTTSDGVAVVHTNAKGRLSWNVAAAEAWRAFSSGNNRWRVTAKAARKKTSQTVSTLLERDGPDCFFCRRYLGDDVTVEHLVPVTAGGPSHLANLVLAHERCNQQAGNLSVMEKIRIRESAP